MNRDNEIDKLFKSFNPVLDTEGLMTDIKDKMDVIDMIRSEQENINRFYRIVSSCCFAAGLSIGIGLMAVVVLMPDGLYSIAEFILGANMSPAIASFCSDYSDLVLTLTASASVILGILPMLNTFHGINSTNSMVRTD